MEPRQSRRRQAPRPTPRPRGRARSSSMPSPTTCPGSTASGLPVGSGVIAVDPSVIPLGTRVFVPGYGPAVAADVGTAVKGNIIDLWMPSTARRSRGDGAPSRSPSTVERVRPKGWRVGLAVAFVACAAAAATPAAGPAGIEPTLTKALTAPSLSLGRTAALAVDVSTGHDRLRPQRIAARRAGFEREDPRLVGGADASRSRIPVPHRGLRRRAREPGAPGTVISSSRASAIRRSRPPTSIVSRRRSAGAESVSSADGSSGTSRSTTRGAARPVGSRTSSGSRRLRCRRSSSTGLRAGRRSRRRSSRLAPSGMRSSATASAVAGRPGLGLAPAAAVSLASDVSDPLAADRPADESSRVTTSTQRCCSSNFSRRRAEWGRRPAAASSSSRRCARQASRPRASGWSTARGSRASTASPRRRSSA